MARPAWISLVQTHTSTQPICWKVVSTECRVAVACSHFWVDCWKHYSFASQLSSWPPQRNTEIKRWAKIQSYCVSNPGVAPDDPYGCLLTWDILLGLYDSFVSFSLPSERSITAPFFILLFLNSPRSSPAAVQVRVSSSSPRLRPAEHWVLSGNWSRTRSQPLIMCVVAGGSGEAVAGNTVPNTSAVFQAARVHAGFFRDYCIG